MKKQIEFSCGCVYEPIDETRGIMSGVCEKHSKEWTKINKEFFEKIFNNIKN